MCNQLADETVTAPTPAPLPVGDLGALLRSEGILTAPTVNGSITALALPVAPDAWLPSHEANEGEFTEIRVVMDAALLPRETEQVAAALQFALKETVWAGSLANPTTIFVDETTRETEMIFPFNSEEVGRDFPNYDIAFRVARVRILLGSNPRLSNRHGLGTYCTQEVEGLGKERCGVEFYVR